ncbi:MAG TPA: hypothetical protein VFJ24_08250, partial [Gaiellales bacterium]|nr:hypothetical protein [Gaiellales bacterium]
MTLFADVLLPLSVSTPYRYAVPAALTPRVVTGTRVLVPVRGRKAVGVVAGVGSEPPTAGTPRPILAAPDAEPALSPELLRLGEWLSSYYGCPRGLSLRALLPGALWGGRAARVDGPAARTEQTITLIRALPSLLERERAFSRAPKRRAAYEALEALGGAAPLRHLMAQLKLGAPVLQGLVRQGLARIDRVAAPRDPFADLAVAPPPEL